MTAAIAGVLLGLGVLAWHLQRRRPRNLKLSFARLLPDPPPEPRPAPRFSLVPPARSFAFWAHALLVAMAAGALWADWSLWQATPSARIGLRAVLDVSHSMSVADGDVSRLDRAKDVLAEHVAAAETASMGAPYCDEAVVAGRSPRREGTADRLGSAGWRMEGGDVTGLVEAARLEAGECPITHVLVITDLPAPAVAWPEDGPVLIWRQVGAPRPNAGIASVRYKPPRLGGGGAELALTVETYGEQEAPRLRLVGPRETQEPRLAPSLDRPGRYVARVAPHAEGDYAAMLEGGGAYGGDDRILFALDAPEALSIDWRLRSWPAPPGVAEAAAPRVVVTPLEDLAEAPRGLPALAVYGGWRETSGPGRIGAFVEDAVLVPLNLDVLERAMPSGVPGPLPPGFEPVLAAQDGSVIVARRASPPGLIVPAPKRSAEKDVEALSLTLFFSALQDVSGGGERPVEARWVSASGEAVPEAWKESDTARPLAARSRVADFAPAPPASQEARVWPWMVVAALIALLAERLWAAVRAWRRRRGDAL